MIFNQRTLFVVATITLSGKFNYYTKYKLSFVITITFVIAPEIRIEFHTALEHIT